MLPGISYLATPDTLARFVRLREEAIRYVMIAGERAMPELYARLGEHGRTACAEDIGFHLDFLLPVVESGDLHPFTTYLAWLNQVLGKRGVPRDWLERALDDLAAFFLKRLGDDALPIARALTDAKDAAKGLSPPEFPCPTPWRESEAFRQAAMKSAHREARGALESALKRERSLTHVAVHVIQPALYEIGRLWQQNLVSVAQEHLATALSMTLLAQQMAKVDVALDNGLRALFACPAGNHHAVGLQIVADAFEIDGWTVYFLGANVPSAALISEVQEIRPHLVGLSASLPTHLRKLRQDVAELRSRFGKDCPKILLGGLVFNQFPQLARFVDADLQGTEACGLANRAREMIQVPSGFAKDGDAPGILHRCPDACSNLQRLMGNQESD